MNATPSKRIQRTDHEWITVLTGRRVDESAAAFTKRIDIPYTYLFALLKRFPEVRKLPAYATGKAEPKAPKAAKVRGIRVLKPKTPKAPPEPGKKRIGRPPGSKNKATTRPTPPVPADPARNPYPPLSAKNAEAMFFQDLSIALKTGRRLRIEFQLMPEGA